MEDRLLDLVSVSTNDKSQVFAVDGKLSEVNSYRINDLLKKYYPYVVNTTSIGKALYEYTNSKSPLLKQKKLIILKSKLKYQDFIYTVKKCTEINNINADTLIIPDKEGQWGDIPITVEMIFLNKEYKTDFRNYIERVLPQITKTGEAELLKRIGYSYDKLMMYKPKLEEEPIITDKVIRKTVDAMVVDSPENILRNLICGKQKKGYKEYMKLCEKYSYTWVIGHFSKVLEKVMELKIKLFKREINLNDLSSADRYKYKQLVLETRSKDVYRLRELLKGANPIETFLKT